MRMNLYISWSWRAPVALLRAFRADRSDPLQETIDHLFLAGLLKGDGELVAVDLSDLAVAELLVKHPVVQGKFRGGAGGFRDQLALDGHRAALVAGEAARCTTARAGKRRLAFIKTAAGLAVAATLAARAICLRPLPARRRIARAERFHIVEARGAVAATTAPARTAPGFRDLDIGSRQLVEKARRYRGRPGAVILPVGA